MLAPEGSWTDSTLPSETTKASLDAIAIVLEIEVRFVRRGQFNHPVIDEQEEQATNLAFDQNYAEVARCRSNAGAANDHAPPVRGVPPSAPTRAEGKT